LAVLAQKPEVAIGAIGNEPKNFKALKGLSTRLTEAIVNSDKYTAVDRSEEILKQLGKEHKYQRSGAVNVERIKELGEQLAAQYMCIVESSELKAGEYLLSARLVDVETAKIEGMGSELSSLKDTKELMRVAEVLVEKLLGSGSAFPAKGKTAPSSVQGSVSGGVLTDTRDGKKYKTVKIGSQIWMAENLNYAANGSKCYDNKPENCKKYGRLYDWTTAMKVCPSGGHLPRKSEYEMLDKAVSTSGKKLKAKSGWNNYKSGWNNYEGNGMDEYGFSALPGGYGGSGGSFSNVGDRGYWWSASEDDSDFAYGRYMRNDAGYAYWGSNDKDRLFSVRCVQD
jgi:uncharacterized protein (TIGR02145 family)